MAQLQRLVVAPDQFQDRQISLTPTQQHYLSQVLRLSVGGRFIAINGQGQWWLAELVSEKINQSEAWQARILEPIAVETELPVTVTLAVALPKGNGFEEVIRQATELGVSYITPVISDRTLLHPSPQKLERWQRIAKEATEQSERQVLPFILDPVNFATYLENSTVQSGDRSSTKRFLGVTRCPAPHLLKCLLSDQYSSLIEIAIGPEGGWTDAEIEQAIAVGFQPVSLGRRILRTVTAPIVALSLISAALEER